MRALTALSLLAAACDGGPLERVPEGSWGGQHVAVFVTADGATLDFDCAHGAITAALRLDAGGAFALPGYLVRDVGPQLDPEARLPATYSGRTDGRSLSLSFTLDDGSGADGPFTALLGAPAELLECR